MAGRRSERAGMRCRATRGLATARVASGRSRWRVGARALVLVGSLCADAQVRLAPRIDALGRTGGTVSGSFSPLRITGDNFYNAADFGPDARSFPHAVRTSMWPLTDEDGWLGRASDGPFCRFGMGEPVPATWINRAEVRCNTVPSSDSPRTVAVELSLDGAEGTYTESGQMFTYYNPSSRPIIDFLYPLSVPLAGGASLTVYGSNFRDVPNGRCRFSVDGAEMSTAAQFIAEGEVACFTPAAPAAGYAFVRYDAGNGLDAEVSEGASLFYSETSPGSSTLRTARCEWTAATDEQPGDCATTHVDVVAGSAATFTISARSAAGTPLVPDGDVFYVDAVPQGLLYSSLTHASGSFQVLEIDDSVQCSRLDGIWSYDDNGQGTCTDTDGNAVDASVTEDQCVAYGDAWIPPVCQGPEGIVAAANSTECLETGLSWNEAVAPQCSSSEALLEPWAYDAQLAMPMTAAECITNGRRWMQLPMPERCIASDGEVIAEPATQQDCELQPCKALGLFQACGYAENAACVPDDVPCGSPTRTWYHDPRTHACFDIYTGERVEADDELECQGNMLFEPPIPAECRNGDGDLMDAADNVTCIYTQNYTWSPGRCEGIEASITVDIRGSYSLEVTAGGEAVAGSPKPMTVSGVSPQDSCMVWAHDCSFNSTALPDVFSFEILSVDQQGRMPDGVEHTVVAQIGPIVAHGLEFTDGTATFEGFLDQDTSGATAALLDLDTLVIYAQYRDALGVATDGIIQCTAAMARCEASSCEITNVESTIVDNTDWTNSPVVGENVEVCRLALECDALGPHGAYGMCNGACVPHGAAICDTGHILSHQESCGLVCTVSDTASYTLSGTQPFCFGGELLNSPDDNIRCTPDPCEIRGIEVPENAYISEECVDGNMLPDGSQLCFATCNEGYYLSDHALQPRCEAGRFFPGSVSCLPYPCQISGIYAPANGRLVSTLSAAQQNAEDSPCMGDDGVLTAVEQEAGIGSYRPICNCNEDYTLQHGQSCALSCNEGYTVIGEQPSCSVGQLDKGSVVCIPDNCPVSGLSAPPNGELDAACANGEELAHGSSCLLTCDNGYSLVGRQPSCFAGTLDVGTVTCLPNMCTVPVVSVPSNAVLGGSCREGNVLPDGSSCNIACKSGYVLTGDQPSCSAGVFDAGSVSCIADFSILWLDREGFLFEASLEGADPELLIDTAAATRDAVFCSFIPGFKKCGHGACVPQYQPCRGSCSDVIDGQTACEDDSCISPSQQCTAGDSKGWCQECISRGLGLSVDNARGHVYWTDPGASVIRWATLESSYNSGGVQSGAIETGRGTDVRDIAVVDGHVFWTCADLQTCGAAAAASGTIAAESCQAADTELCESATSSGAGACTAAGECEYTPYADAACVATAALVCDAVSLPSDEATCHAAGACTYTPATEGVAESCRASGAAACAGVQNFNRTTCEDYRPSWWNAVADPCTYVPVREPTCTAVDAESCSSVPLGGLVDTTRAACYAAGNCYYTPSSASAGVVMASDGALVDLGFSDTAFAVAVNDAADEVFWSGLPSQHTCDDLADIGTCDDGRCAAEDAHCTGNLPDIGFRSVLRAAVAADSVCDAVQLSGAAVDNAMGCHASGNCEYVAAAAEVLESCVASDTAACMAAADGTEQSCLDAAESGSCTFGPATSAACTAAATSACNSVSLPTDQNTCENAGDCAYTPENTESGVAESCAAVHDSTCRALDDSQASCEDNADCRYNAAQPATCTASDSHACSSVDFGTEAHTAAWGRNLCESSGACTYTAYDAEVLEDCIAPAPGAVVREGRAAMIHAPANRASSIVYNSAQETLYWADWHSDSIFSRTRASADNEAPTELVGTAGGAADLAIDQESGWLYWTSEVDESIKRICVGTSTGEECPYTGGSASIGDVNVVVGGVQAVALAVSRPLLSCPFTELSRRSPVCVALLGHANVAADCVADTEGCRSLVCDYCTHASNFNAAGCPGWRVQLGCSETTLVTAEGAGCIFPMTVDGFNATATSCEDMMDYAAAMIDSGKFSDSMDNDRVRYPWCYTTPPSNVGDNWIDAAEAAGAWGWCYDRVTDPCSTATGCTSCGAMSWTGRPDQRCRWCESAHRCAPTAEYCAVTEDGPVDLPHQYVQLHLNLSDGSTSSVAQIGSDRSWKPLPAVVYPSAVRMRDQCSDFYFYEHDYASDVVYDPSRQYFVPPTSQEAAAERWKRDGWFDFTVPDTLPWDVAPWCTTSESGHGLVRQVDRLRPCTNGRTITNSPTVCVGTVGEQCSFLCTTGFSPVGDHVCHADGVFRGGRCTST